jgi:hypothetical protein
LDPILHFFKSIFSILAKLFTVEDESVDNPGKNVRRASKTIRKSGKVAAALVIAIYLLLAFPLAGWIWYLGRLNDAKVAEISSLKTANAALESAAKTKVTVGRRSAYRELIRTECKAMLSTYSDVLSEIENDPYWPSLDSDGSTEALKSIENHSTTIRRHLTESTKFNRWLSGRIPPEFHGNHDPLFDALDLFKSRCMPQLDQANAKTNLTLLKVEVMTAFKELLGRVRQTLNEEDAAEK